MRRSALRAGVGGKRNRTAARNTLNGAGDANAGAAGAASAAQYFLELSWDIDAPERVREHRDAIIRRWRDDDRRKETCVILPRRRRS